MNFKTKFSGDYLHVVPMETINLYVRWDIDNSLYYAHIIMSQKCWKWITMQQQQQKTKIATAAVAPISFISIVCSPRAAKKYKSELDTGIQMMNLLKTVDLCISHCVLFLFLLELNCVNSMRTHCAQTDKVKWVLVRPFLIPQKMNSRYHTWI